MTAPARSDATNVKPVYTDDEIFTLIEMTLGAPPEPKARMCTSVAEHKREADYHNDLTSLLLSFFPGDIPRIVAMRDAFYWRHEIFSFGFVDRINPTR